MHNEKLASRAALGHKQILVIPSTAQCLPICCPGSPVHSTSEENAHGNKGQNTKKAKVL